MASPRKSKFAVPSLTAASGTTNHEIERKRARYRIIEQKRSSASPLGSPCSSGRRPNAPPAVHSTTTHRFPDKDTGNSASEFKIFEAAIESDEGAASVHPVQRKLETYANSRRQKLATLRASKETTRKQTEEEEDMLMNFVPMMKEYLSRECFVMLCMKLMSH